MAAPIPPILKYSLTITFLILHQSKFMDCKVLHFKSQYALRLRSPLIQYSLCQSSPQSSTIHASPVQYMPAQSTVEPSPCQCSPIQSSVQSRVLSSPKPSPQSSHKTPTNKFPLALIQLKKKILLQKQVVLGKKTEHQKPLF